MRVKKGGVARREKKLTRAPRPARETDLLPPSRYLFFGGKGGVGKTTAAAATALRLLNDAGSGEQILLFSTDPAHSLSDSLELEIGDRLTEVARRGGARLLAYEMEAGAALSKFKTEHRAILAEIADRGTLLDESDINELLDLSLPGMDEVMALFELSELDRAGEYARIVVDTAPSGHTSRLLKLPEVFQHMLAALDRMADKHRYIVAQFARGARPRADEVDLFLGDLAERINRVRSMLHDAARTSFTLVTIPEPMSVDETARYYDLLRAEGVPVTDLIINRIEEEHGGCAFCLARSLDQKPSLQRIRREFDQLRIHYVPLLPAEVRGVNPLRRFARLAWEQGEGVKKKAEGRRKKAARAIGSLPDDRSTPPTAYSLLPSTPRLLIFGGKGGVGKTTAAAAAALALAGRDPRSRVLVFSTDPAHSLSDSFGEPVGELKEGVAGVVNLYAMEIDPAARFEELKSRYRAWTDELFASLGGGSRWEIQFDREAMRELVALAPPGIDEIAALAAISDLLEQDRYATVVLDTAPTGHLVRFLELPGVALSWVRTFIKLLLKYQSVVRPSGVAEELIALSKSVKRVIALLTDASACEFVGVAIPERMSLEETYRLARTLERLGIPMRRLLVNGVVPREAATGCDFCRARREAQDKMLEEFRKRFGDASYIFTAPERPREIRGAGPLLEHFSSWQPLTCAHTAGEGRKRSRGIAAPLTGKGRARKAVK